MAVINKNPIRFQCKSFAIRLKSYEEMDKEADKLIVSKIPEELTPIKTIKPINLKKH